MNAMETMIMLKNLRNAIYAMGGLSICRDNQSIVGEQYEAIDEAIKAVKKTIPQKVTHEATLYERCTCPNCKSRVDEFADFFEGEVRIPVKYCKFCGQALDWSEE